MELINLYLDKLNKSKFRSSFHLKESDFKYIEQKSIDTIKSHAYDFITKKLAPLNPTNDGKQTPMHGHPVFIAQHATATCCRGCLNKWYNIPLDRPLTQKEIDFVVEIIMEWINREIKLHQQ